MIAWVPQRAEPMAGAVSRLAERHLRWRDPELS
jgi:hypothetical protein